MNPSANIPAGSATDSSAPWNLEKRDMCKRCDKDEITQLWSEVEQRLIAEMSDDGDLTSEQCALIDDKEDEFRRGFSMCKNCEQ